MNGLYHLGELPTQAVERLVQRALDFRRGVTPVKFPGRGLGLFFLSPSLRTQASFQRAAAKLGLDLVQLQGGGNGVWQLELTDGAVMNGGSVEHVREAAAVLGRFVDVLAIRAFSGGQDLALDLSDPIVNGFRRFAGVPIVNMESALWHPCQALADWATLDMLGVPKRAKFVLTWANHPKPLPHAVPNSTLAMALQRGMDVVLARPKGYDLHERAMAEAQRLAHESGGRLTVTDDRDAVEGAAVVYAKSWGSLAAWGDLAREQHLRAGLAHWCVDGDLMRRAGPNARFMHCLPVRRNVVVKDEVLDGPWSVVIDQAENRLHAQTALLERIFLDLEAQSKAKKSSLELSMKSSGELEEVRP
ncbi:MAG: N-acetylornithine carbamoyltransferase [Planctomycetes bacterium]|nr:N-acetylornithine carbamoyltransferase [Planctomycetota bacterium]